MVGLTRRGHVGGSLLKQINGVRTDGSLSKSTRSTSKQLALADQDEDSDCDMKGGIYQLAKDKQEENIHRQPDSSDDEESRDIRPTAWKRSSPAVASHHDADDDSLGPIRGQPVSKTRKKAQLDSTSLRRSRRGTNEMKTPTKVETAIKTPPSRGLDPAFGFQPRQGRKRKVATYGSQPKRRAATASQEKVNSSPEAKFIQPRSLLGTPDSGKPKKKLKVRNLDGLLLSSPIKAPQFKSRPALSPSSGNDSDVPVFRMSGVISSDDELSSLGATPDVEDLHKLTDDDPSERPVFRMPVNLDFSFAGGSVELSDGEDKDLELDGHDATETSFDDPPVLSEVIEIATCPMCGEAVEPDHLKTFSKGNTMNIRSQTKFCRAHKRKSARNEWSEKHYPTIDWSSFDSRVSTHYNFIDSLLEGASNPSRDALQESVRLGKDRTLLQAMNSGSLSLSPGYYGTRGLRAMSENIVQKFSAQLRRIAVTDRLVAARGVSGYVQSVLVPELAVRLIAEDMKVDDEEARVVMRESVVVGELLSEEVDDVVVWNGEEHEDEF